MGTTPNPKVPHSLGNDPQAFCNINQANHLESLGSELYIYCS